MKTFIVVIAPALIAAAAVWALATFAADMPIAARAAIMATVVVGAILGMRKLSATREARQKTSAEQR